MKCDVSSASQMTADFLRGAHPCTRCTDLGNGLLAPVGLGLFLLSPRGDLGMVRVEPVCGAFELGLREGFTGFEEYGFVYSGVCRQS